MRRLVPLLGVLYLAVTSPVVGIYLWANGMTAGALALASLLLFGGLGIVAAMRAPLRRRAVLGIGLFVTIDLVWVAARVGRAGGEGPQVCVNTQCDGRGAFWQRVPDEREAARAGLYVSALAGGVSGAELRAFDTLLDTEYARFEPSWRGLPNALLMSSSPSRIESLRWIPANARNAPCIVFLHGFGGSLTAYLRAMVESEIGKRFVVAPALDNVGMWGNARGLEVIERVVEQLPPEVDRARVHLVGLSNGSIGATAVLAHPRLRASFAGVVLVSGIGELGRDTVLGGIHVLLVTGVNDPRFPYPWVKRQAATLIAAGADVEVMGLDADHYLILTHAPQWTARFLAWERAIGGR